MKSKAILQKNSEYAADSVLSTHGSETPGLSKQVSSTLNNAANWLSLGICYMKNYKINSSKKCTSLLSKWKYRNDRVFKKHSHEYVPLFSETYAKFDIC